MNSRQTGMIARGLAILLFCCTGLGRAQPDPAVPWFNREKIRFFWGPWEMWDRLGLPETAKGDIDPLTNEELTKRLAGVGVTVFVDRRDWTFHKDIATLTRGGYSEDYYGATRPALLKRARLAHKYGLRYFSHRHSASLPQAAEETGARLAVNRDGNTSKESPRAGDRYVPCPLDERAVDEWLFKYAIDMARTGVVDGCHIDWEMSIADFSGLGDETCYCDDCFGNYTRKRGLTQEIARQDRYNRLRKQRLLRDYLVHQRDRLKDMYRRGAERVRALKPDFVFSAYDGFMPGHLENCWRVEGAALGLHSPAAPFVVADAMHYWPNHTAAWWDTGYSRFRKLGMRLVPGSWVGGIMGGQPEMDVSAVQWIYDTAMTQDGYWLWFEHKWGPRDYAVFRSAHQRIRAAEHRMGDFLFKGTQDTAFVTVVEQSGDPALGRHILARSYHLGTRHLAQLHNVNTNRPAAVLVRFPRLAPGTAWTVADPMSGLLFTHDLDKPAWQADELARGVLLTMEKRSEAWLLLAPVTGSPATDALQTVSADPILGHPSRPETAASLPAGKPVSAEFPLLFLRTGPLGYAGEHQPVMGSLVFFIDAGVGRAAEDRHVFGIKGNCWTPTLSPDLNRIAFSAYVNGRGQIYVEDAGAAALTGLRGREQYARPYWANAIDHSRTFGFRNSGVNVSRNEFCEHSPAWSPDGARLAFVSDRHGDWEIYVMNADGSAQRRLTRSPGVDRAPAWSPDGSRIAFETDRNGDFDIYMIRSDGTGERALADRAGQDLEPRWSPRGSALAFIGNQYGYHRDVMVIDLDSGATAHPKGLTHAATGWWAYTNVHSICWSPDGKSIAGVFEKNFQKGSGIFIVRADLSRTATSDMPEGFVQPHEESDDDEQDEVELTELVTVPPLKPHPGGEVSAHKMVGGWYFDGSASHPFVVRTFKDLAWSPDGRTIAFRSDMDPSGYEFFYTLPADGGKATRLDNTLSPMGLKNEPVPLNPVGGSWEPPPAVKLPAGKKLLADAPEFWLFRTDPDKAGDTNEWFAPAAKGPPWRAASTHDFWDKFLGTKKQPHYLGDGWYALDLIIPSARGKRVWLHFGAVDENYTLWINGQYIGNNLAAGTSMWEQPVSVEITGEYRPGQSNHVVVRVTNTAFAGGIWKPVVVLTEKE